MHRAARWSAFALPIITAAIGGLLWGCGMTSDEPVDPMPVHAEIWPAVESPMGLDPTIEVRIDDLLSTMSVEDKVGQIIQGRSTT